MKRISVRNLIPLFVGLFYLPVFIGILTITGSLKKLTKYWKRVTSREV